MSTIKSAAITAWKNATQNKQQTPLITAIGEMINSLTGDEQTFRDERIVYRFAQRIAARGESRIGVCRYPALDYCGNWTGEWHVTDTDLYAFGTFLEWLGRSEYNTGMARRIFSDVSRALRCKRMFQAYQRYQSTGLTPSHCKLLARMGWEMDTSRGDWVSLYVQGKRPFGNSSIANDIYKIVGWELDPEDEGCLTTEQEERAWDLFDELVFAASDAAVLAGQALAGATP